MRSAELHSAVSPMSNRQGSGNSKVIADSSARQNAILRYSRVQLCATYLRTPNTSRAPWPQGRHAAIVREMRLTNLSVKRRERRAPFPFSFSGMHPALLW
jgi:hypothetical protein